TSIVCVRRSSRKRRARSSSSPRPAAIACRSNASQTPRITKGPDRSGPFSIGSCACRLRHDLRGLVHDAVREGHEERGGGEQAVELGGHFLVLPGSAVIR